MKHTEDEEYTGLERRTHVDWHLNRSVAITIIILLLGNIGTSIWWASSINSDVSALSDIPENVSEMKERVIKLETTVDVHEKYFNKLNATLDKFNITLERIDREQARRKSIVDRAEKEQGRNIKG